MFSPGSGANNGTIAFYGNNTERVRINSTGVGIYTSNPRSTLDVNGGIVAGDSNGYALFVPKPGTDPWTNYDRFELRVNAGSAVTYLGNTNGGTGSKRALALLSGNAEAMRLDTSGNVGIGTTTPNAKLNVVGSAHFSRDNASECCSSNDYTVAISELTNSTGKMSAIQFHNSGIAEGYFRLAGSGARRFQMGDTQGVTMGLQMS